MQIETIYALEQSLSADRPRALIQMVAGSGSTVMGITARWHSICLRLSPLHFRRPLFLLILQDGKHCLPLASGRLLSDRTP